MSLSAMRICHIGLEIVPRRGFVFCGGLANNVVRISEAQYTQYGHDICIITSDVNRVLHTPLSLIWGKIHPVQTQARSLYSGIFAIDFFLKAVVIMIREHRASRFHVVHIHSSYPILGSFAVVSSLAMRVPTILTLYSPVTARAKGNGLGSRIVLHWSLSKLFLRMTHKVATLSNNTRETLIRIGIPGHKIVTMPPTVDPAVFNPSIASIAGQAKRVELSVAEHQPVILYCGNWRPWKGVELLVESTKRLVREFPGLLLVLAFGEPIVWHLEGLSRIQRTIEALGLEEHVLQLGIVLDVSRLMAACDVFAAPFRSTQEVADIPVSILEAMACGKPVIATNVGGIPEVVKDGENGLLIAPDNPEQLDSCIRSVLANPEAAKRLGRNAASYVLENFSVVTVVKRLQRVYDELVLKEGADRIAIKRCGLIAIVGIDGTGKTTQALVLAEELRARHVKCIYMRPRFELVRCFPSIGKFLEGRLRVRSVLTGVKSRSRGSGETVHSLVRLPLQFILFFYSLLTYLVIIRGRLRNLTVICDRYFFDWFGTGRTRWGWAFANSLPMPDLVFLLDSPLSVTRSRICSTEDKLTSPSYFGALREWYLSLAKIRRFTVVDASARIETVKDTILHRVLLRFGWTNYA